MRKANLAKSSHDETEGEDHLPEEGNVLAKLAASGISDEDFLRKSGIYYIFGEIKEGSLQPLHQNILLKHYIGPKHFRGDLTFLINSPGGDVDETNSLLDLIKNIRLQVRTVGFGKCMSAAAMLLAAGTKGKRIVGPSTTIMIHPYAWGVYGKHHELVAHRHPQDEAYSQMLNFWMTHSKYKNRKEVEKYLLRKEDTFLTAKEALKHGIIDAIGDVVI